MSEAQASNSIAVKAELTARLHSQWCSPNKPDAVSIWREIDSLPGWLRRALVAASKAEAGDWPAAEWLLDNAYRVQRAAQRVHKDLPPGFYARLRRLDQEARKGEPLLLALAHDLLDAAHFQLSRAAVLDYLEAYQRVLPLRIAELWALPVMLRLACLERLTLGFAKVFPQVPSPIRPSASCIEHAAQMDPSHCVARGVANLGIISSINWQDVFDASSLVERVLGRDPCAIYPRMDFDTRDGYRRAVEELALQSSSDELAVAEAARAAAHGGDEGPLDHVGYWLIGEGRIAFEARIGARPGLGRQLARRLGRHPGVVYNLMLFILGMIGLAVPAAILAWNGADLAGWAIGLALAALPATVVAVTAANWLVTQTVRPRQLPKLDFAKGIAADWQTVIAVPVIIGHPNEIAAIAAQLEQHYLGNASAHAIVLLSDLHDGDSERLPADEAIERALRAAIDDLNRRHVQPGSGGPFCLLHRARQFNPAQGCWMGWERKRGKLEQFNAFLLHGDSTPFVVSAGAIERLPGARLVVTVDADTRLPLGTVAKMAGTLAHPLNRASFNEQGRVVSGYTVLQPRVEIAPLGSDTIFSRLFGGDTAIDIYSRAVSDAFQDLLGTGNFVGKGIYDVAAFSRSLAGKVPENNLLSHDLWEGLQGRAGLVSDVIIYESFPTSYAEYARRWHRWVRGDWQLLPWLFPWVPGEGRTRLRNRLSLFDRMRIWDNMRRSLVPPSVLLLMLGGWFILPGSPILWTLFALLAPGAYLFTDLVTGLARGRRRGVLQRTLQQYLERGGRWALSVAFLVSDSAIALHAVGTTLLRLRNHTMLLEWTSAAHVRRRLGAGSIRAGQWSSMWPSPLLAVALLPALAFRPEAAPAALPLLLLWFLAPELAWWTGREPRPEQAELALDDRAFLRKVARRSWLYFESYAGPEDNWLPPDNHQEEPVEATAHRTSPTNIGMMVVSALSAWRLGHISSDELSIRMRDLLNTLDRLESWRGHLLNWYETTTLAPLEPRYVSTVDSGNLAVSLLTLARACEEIADNPDTFPALWQGLDDVIALVGEAAFGTGLLKSADEQAPIAELRSAIAARSGDPTDWGDLLEYCSERYATLRAALQEGIRHAAGAPRGSLRELRSWLELCERQLAAMRRERELAMPWLKLLEAAPAPCQGLVDEWAGDASRATSGQGLPALAQSAAGLGGEAVAWSRDLARSFKRARAFRRLQAQRLRSVARRAAALAEGMDFTPLYDRHEKLFYIGYDLSGDRIDQHHYDLLASEARLASYFAIAKRDVPFEHWFHLGRPVVKLRGGLALVSWNGSMFEYLMPTLFLRSDPDTLLGRSDRSSVELQRRYCARRGVPWGISESGYATLGSDGSWRYRAFGVPELGLRRGLGEDLVIAPYASALALSVVPSEAAANLRHLAQMGALGRYGFHEALDFTAQRRSEARKFSLVRSYMAHHHGMSIAAIANALFDNVFVRWFHADPRIQMVDLLLNERIPWELPAEIERIEPAKAPQVGSGSALRPQPWDAEEIVGAPALHLIGNGRLETRIASDGSGMLEWKGMALTRPGEAAGSVGHFIHLRDRQDGTCWSPTGAPLGSPGERRTIFHAHKAEFHCQHAGISAGLDVLVAPGEDVEVRRLRLVNTTANERRIEMVSHAEIALAPDQEWLRHPAFARLFVRAQIHPSIDGVLMSRQVRGPAEPGAVLLQRLVLPGEGAVASGAQVAREATFGRYGRWASFPRTAPFGEPMAEWPLDPVVALRADLILPPHGSADLGVVTAVALSDDDALELGHRYGSLAALDWAEQDADTQSTWVFQTIGLAGDKVSLAQRIYAQLAMRHGPRATSLTRSSRQDLWARGISGDFPILLLELSKDYDSALSRLILAMHRLWRWHSSPVDLVVLYDGGPGYIDFGRDRLLELLREVGSLELEGQRGGVHLLGRESFEPGKLSALRLAAGITLSGHDFDVEHQLSRQLWISPPRPAFVPIAPARTDSEGLPAETGELAFANEFGGFAQDGSYRIASSALLPTPAPWANVIANSEFGTVVNEGGLGFTFAQNGGENRLTPWHNDPLLDPQSEALYLRDEETGQVWTVSSLPAGGDEPCVVEHGKGITTWRRDCHGLSQTKTCLVATDDPVKLVRLGLVNRGDAPRRLTVTYFADWLLGAVADEPGPFRLAWYQPDLEAILATNHWNQDFGGRVAFLAADRSVHSVTTSRRDFLGAVPNRILPEGLHLWDLGNRTDNCGPDAAAAIQVHLDIPPGATVECSFILGQGSEEADAKTLISRWREERRLAKEPTRVAARWQEHCGALEVESPDPAFDMMVNHWLPYQAMSSRLLARVGPYQAGGAFGFRDQLQDVLATLLADPDIARRQILRAAAHQFEAGDVLHWWHPPAGRGVRTRYSDDLLWLPFVTAQFVKATGDVGILRERVPFLAAPELQPDEHDRYAAFPNGADASLYEHCLRAFDRSWNLGKHELPLIGEGDWNDGMNRIGIGGHGESVWLGWFLAATIRNFAAMSSEARRDAFAARWLSRADELVAAIDQHAWDGAWYMRAFDDHGRPWGSSSSEECRIDSLTQSWAVIAGGGDPERAATALNSAFEHLVRPDDRIVRLLDPPFTRSARDPGYIKAYPPGIRENGGQYSHAAAWLGIAAAIAGDGDRAKQVLDRLNPITHWASVDAARTYRIEPYVVAADIGGEEPWVGRGGWSWYTGAAAWTWRLATEHILGIALDRGRIVLSPCLPSDWPGYRATLRGKGTIEISVSRADSPGVRIDGKRASPGPVEFPGVGRKRVVELSLSRAGTNDRDKARQGVRISAD